LLGALPSIFIKPQSVAESSPAAWNSADVFTAPNAIFGTIEDRLLWPSRLSMLTFAVLLGWVLYAWASELFGADRAWLPLALYAFCPVVLANAPLITTDVAGTTLIFAAFYAWWRYLQQPSLPRLVWVCLSVAAAFAAKHTALILVPSFLILGVVAVAAPTILPFNLGRRLKIVAGAMLMIGVTTLFGIDVVYFFDGVFLTPPEFLARAQYLVSLPRTGAEQVSQFWPSWLPIPLPFYYVVGLLSVMTNVGQAGHWTYFLGQAGGGGWRNYFPMLLLIKLSIPALLLIGLGVSRAFFRLPREWWNILFLVLPPLLLISVASSGKMNIGIRHILPAFPFLFLLAGYVLRYRLKRWALILVGTLVALNAVSSLAIHPYYLMYFNFLAGGPEQGWRISVTGDDYGQGDADLRRWLQVRKINTLAFLPDGWGGMVLTRANIGYTAPPCEDTGELVAVHIERLVTPTTLNDARCYSWMRLREPDEKIGYSIFIYNSKNLRPPPPANLTLFSQALALQLKGEIQAAIPLYQTYLTQEPNYYQAHFNLGAALLDTNQCPLAIPEFERTLELWRGYKEAHVYLAKCYAEIGRPDRSQWHAEQLRK
jgi:hypothetical protein